MATGGDFLGRGWTFPPQFEPTLQGVVMAEREVDIAQSLQVLLTTSVGERIMEPRYGCNMEDLLFESLDTATLTLINDKINTAILYFEPRIDVQRMDVNTARLSEGILLIEIDYIVRATNSRFNFVFPFYRTEGSEISILPTNTLIAS